MLWFLAVIVLLAILPIGIGARYNDQGATVWACIGPLRIGVYPSKKKPKEKKQKQKKQQKQSKPSPKSAKKDKPKEKSGGSLRDFIPLVEIALDFISEFFTRKLRVKRLELKVTMAGDDPCDLAVNYGRAWAALGNLWPRLEELLIIKKRDVQLQCDFTSSETKIYTCVELTITLGRLVSLAVRYGWKALREYLKIRNLRKGGASV